MTKFLSNSFGREEAVEDDVVHFSINLACGSLLCKRPFIYCPLAAFEQPRNLVTGSIDSLNHVLKEILLVVVLSKTVLTQLSPFARLR